MRAILSGAMLAVTLLGAMQANAEGALAFGRESGRTGVSYDFRNYRDADDRALRECGARDCRIVGRYSNQCGAIATGRNGGFGWATRRSRGEAERAAVENCRSEGNRGCSVESRGCDG